MQSRETIVVGAGPAGLTAAWYLRRHGLDCLVLDQADRVGATFAAQPAWMRLLSPARLTRVPGMDMPQDRYPMMNRYAELLADHAARQDFEIRTGCRVENVRRSGARFALQTSRGEIEARDLIFATGIYANPQVPDVAGLDRAAVPWFHTSDAARHEEPAGARVLIVGGGVSGTELALRLGAHNRVWLSERRPRWRAPRHVLGVDLHYLAWPLERLSRPRGRPFREPVFTRWARMLRRQGVERVASLVEMRGDVAILAGGAELSVDRVVFATGYRPALRPLEDLGALPDTTGLESDAQPGLFFLGVPALRTYASGYVRGFAADARWIVRRIVRRRRSA